MSEPVKVKGTILHETELAIKFAQINDQGETSIVWIPRAECSLVTKHKLIRKGWEATIELPEWLADAKELEVER